MKNIINVIALFTLFHIINTSNEKEIEILINILDCLVQNNNMNKTKIISLKNGLNNYNPFIINKVYDFLHDNMDIVEKCINNIKDIPNSMLRYIYPINKVLGKYNWDAYLNCLLEYNGDNSLKDLINLIISKNYYDALSEEKKLLIHNSENVLICSGKKRQKKYSDDMCVSLSSNYFKK